MQNWEIDPKTGDYIMQGGSPKQTDSLRIPAYFRLKTQRTRWLYAPDDKFGSDFYAVTKRQSTRDSSQIETIAATALQPLADDGRAAEITVETQVVARQGVGLKVEIVEANGRFDELILPPLGV